MVIKVIGSAEDKPISIKIKDLQYVDGLIGDYELLTSKPQINGHELSGDQSFEDLGLGTYIERPANPTKGAFLIFNGNAWVGQTIEMWQEGGNY